MLDKTKDAIENKMDKCIEAILGEWNELEFDDNDDNQNLMFFEAIVKRWAKKFELSANEVLNDERIKSPNGCDYEDGKKCP